jgi:hypothetical protein
VKDSSKKRNCASGAIVEDQEDLAGKPFGGPAGKLLGKALQGAARHGPSAQEAQRDRGMPSEAGCGDHCDSPQGDRPDGRHGRR